MTKKEKIVKLGHPVLRQIAKKVNDLQSNDVIEIIKDMLSILADSEGVGLAAPQIGESIRIMVIASRPSKRYPHAPVMEPVVMINPNYEVLSKVPKEDWEGCLSIPGIRALVFRDTKIKITYFDQQSQVHELIADDFVARIFQHEFDHFEGLVYLDRVTDNKKIISEEAFQKLGTCKE